jgi:hypothetical protein
LISAKYISFLVVNDNACVLTKISLCLQALEASAVLADALLVASLPLTLQAQLSLRLRLITPVQEHKEISSM